MSDLKTLDDIPIPNRTFTRRILKAEAVKWVKDIHEELKLFPTMSKGLERTAYWIKHFFNLTEEDLK